MLVHRHHSRPVWKALIQSGVRWFFRILLTLFYRIRVHGLSRYPGSGPMLVCCNHQSFLDPIVLGVVCPRPLNYLARKTLFRWPPLNAFLSVNDAISIDRDAVGLAGIKESLKRLKRGETVLIFPEGTRSTDGSLQGLKTGFDILARRAKAALLPVAVDGCYDAYPRDSKLPSAGKIHVVIGQPIYFEQYQDLSPEQTTQLMHQKIAECLVAAQNKRRRISSAAS